VHILGENQITSSDLQSNSPVAVAKLQNRIRA
jgi:hypothetical protein